MNKQIIDGVASGDAIIKKLGKISSIHIGNGGYDNAMLGLEISFLFDGGSSGRVKFYGAFKDRMNAQVSHDVMMRIKGLLEDAKVEKLSQLTGKPIEGSFKSEFGALEEFRILTEVI